MAEVLEENDFGCSKDAVVALTEAILGKKVPFKGKEVSFNKMACIIPLDGNGDAGKPALVVDTEGKILEMSGMSTRSAESHKKKVRPATPKEIDVFMEDVPERGLSTHCGFIFEAQALIA